MNDINPITHEPFTNTQQKLIEKFKHFKGAIPLDWFETQGTGLRSAMKYFEKVGLVKIQWNEYWQAHGYNLLPDPPAVSKGVKKALMTPKEIFTQYPEHARYAMVEHKITAVLSFLGSFDYGNEPFRFCEYKADWDSPQYDDVDRTQREKMIYKFFGVDYDKFFAEKSDMLEQVMLHSNQPTTR